MSLAVEIPDDSLSAADRPGSLPVPAQFLKRFSVEEYHDLIDKGAFANDEAYELLEGWVIHKMGKKRAHSLVTRRLRKFLEPLAKGFYVETQEPLTTTDSEPEPDVLLVRGDAEDYPDRQPLAKDTLLVVEVAEGSVARDRSLKKRIYARAGIPVYWIVNLKARQVEVYTEPSGSTKKPDYKSRQIIAADGTLPVIIDGKVVGQLKVKDLLP